MTLPRRLARTFLGGALATASATSLASLGPYEPGNGIKAQGLGGITYAVGEETTALYGNPAHLFNLGERIDLGITFPTPIGQTEIKGNALAPDQSSKVAGRRFFYIPQGGFSRRLSERWMFGMTAFAAGLGTDFTSSPYERFGGSKRAALFLSSSGVATALAYQLTPRNVIGATLNLGYQTIEIEGFQFLADPAISENPDKVSNQGKDGAFNIGFNIGWLGKITDRLNAAVAYRSKTWAEKHDDYSGILPEQGRFEFPAIFGAGLAYDFTPQLTLAFDYQRYQYSSQKAFGHRIARLNQGNLLGSDNGPGFGLENQDAYKFGVLWNPDNAWTYRLGYISATQMAQASENFFGGLGLVSASTHFSGGLSYQFQKWEVSGSAIYSKPQKVKGRDSIPAAFGGGESNTRTETLIYGFTIGTRFGN